MSKTSIIKKINSLSASKSTMQVFSDWIKCTALAISQSVVYVPSREQEYRRTIEGYSVEDFSRITAELALLCENGFDDVLGSIYMGLGFGNHNTGQFFTPYSLSLACAKLTGYSSDEPLRLNEPSAGAGGMIIATAQAMKEQGIDFQRRLRVVAQDLDMTAWYMCYVQLSLFGVNAKVVQGDSLKGDRITTLSSNVMITPMYLIDGCRW